MAAKPKRRKPGPPKGGGVYGDVIRVRVEPETEKALRREARRRGRTVSETIRLFLRRSLNLE